MKRTVFIDFIIILIGFLAIVGCVPKREQIVGTWEFSGYKNGAVQSIIPTDSTICFESNGGGYYYSNSNVTQRTDLEYCFTDNDTILISTGNKEKEVQFNVEWKATRLTLDGLVYRRIEPLESMVTQSNVELLIPSATIVIVSLWFFHLLFGT